MRLTTLLRLAPLIASALAAPFNETYGTYNLNTNQNAQSPLDYDTDFVPSTYHPSPASWRFPFYTVLMDKFADGDPTNNDFFGSPFEWDWRETNFRFGGDLAGLESKLDYLAGMGIKAIFAAGTPWINMIWQADSASTSIIFFLVLSPLMFSPLSLSLILPFDVCISLCLIIADCVAFPPRRWLNPITFRFQVTPLSTSPPWIRTGANATNGVR